jgi:hypothetical protein
MPEDVNPAAPSTAELDTAQDAALGASDYSRYAEVENARDQNKALPEAPPPSSVKPPAPEPGTDKSIQEKPKPKTGEDRKAELHAEIQELLRQRAELQGKTTETPGEKKADPPPAAVTPPATAKPAEAAKPGEAPIEPNLDDKNADGTDKFSTYPEYQKAERKWIRDTIAFEAKQAIASSNAEREAAAANKAAGDAWVQKRDAAHVEFPDWFEVINSSPGDNFITPVMHEFIRDSENGARVLYKLCENGGIEGKRVMGLAPMAAARALFAIENGLATPAAKTAPVKRITTAAPAPATDLRSTNAEPADAIQAALSRGDVGEYMRLSNVRDLKARRAA